LFNNIDTTDSWMFSVGENFGLTANGDVFCKNLTLGSGTIGTSSSIFISTTGLRN
jgi:hypothetical protein